MHEQHNILSLPANYEDNSITRMLDKNPPTTDGEKPEDETFVQRYIYESFTIGLSHYILEILEEFATFHWDATLDR